MPEHWYSNQYLVGSQTIGGGYGGRGFFDERKLNAQRKQEQSTDGSDRTTEGETETEFHFTSGGYQGSIGTPEAGTSGEWCDQCRAIMLSG